MEKLSLPSSKASSSGQCFLSPFSFTKRTTLRARRTLSFNLCRPRKFVVLACKDDPKNKLTEHDIMEFKFGQMLGEDPKLTLAKIMGRKVNPDASYLEIEKNFYKNKGKIIEVKEVPFDVPEKRGSPNAKNELNLLRPVPKKGIKVGSGDDLSSVNKKKPKPSGNKASTTSRSSVPNIILRKPSVYNENDDEMAESLKLRIKPNLSLKMRTEPVKEKLGGMTLLKRPEQVSISQYGHESQKSSDNDDSNITSGVEEKDMPKKDIIPDNLAHAIGSNEVKDPVINDVEKSLGNQEQKVHESSSKLTMLEKPKPFAEKNTVKTPSRQMAYRMEKNLDRFLDSVDANSSNPDPGDSSEIGLQLLEPTDVGPHMNVDEINNLPAEGLPSSSFCVEAVLQGKPQRLDQSVNLMPRYSSLNTSASHESFIENTEWMNSSKASVLKEDEDSDWGRAEELARIGYRTEVELISCNTRGFAVSFGSLIGFLPYRNLTDRFKFFAFPSWVRKKGLDPSKYRPNLGVVGSYEFLNYNGPLVSSSETVQNAEVEITAEMELEDLLRIYDQEKIKFLSSFIGQRRKLYVSLVDKKSKRLIFSLKPKEKVEVVEKKRNLMARLSIGDVVKCSVTKITYFGIFVEVEGVPALIHQSEVSWDATLDPTAEFKIGQILEAKVIELDYPLERISLSLKDILPDPMSEALECVVGDKTTVTGRFETSETNTEWDEVDSLIKELESIDGVRSVSKGRLFLSPGLAPTFQVYMASVFDDQYKLLARSGNKAQEVVVEASLGNEEMKTVILTCTNRVA